MEGLCWNLMKRSQNNAGQTPKPTSGGPGRLTAQQYLDKYSVTAYLKVRKCIESTQVGPVSCYLLATRLRPPPTPTRAVEHTTLAAYPSPPAPTPWRSWRRETWFIDLVYRQSTIHRLGPKTRFYWIYRRAGCIPWILSNERSIVYGPGL